MNYKKFINIKQNNTKQTMILYNKKIKIYKIRFKHLDYSSKNSFLIILKDQISKWKERINKLKPSIKRSINWKKTFLIVKYSMSNLL